MDTPGYPSPVDKLLAYGPCDDIISYEEWPDYLELGFGPEHIPDLIRLAMDTTSFSGDSSDPRYCAPVHAWRTLGQLRAQEAIEPLITLAEDPEYGDLASDELGDVYGLIGPPAIPTLAAYLADKSHQPLARADAIGCIQAIGIMHPEAKVECVAALIRQLELFEENNPTVNSFLILALKELKVLDAMPLIKQAFDAGYIDQLVTGDWDDIQVLFGLKQRDEVPQRGLDLEEMFSSGIQPMKKGDVFPLPLAPARTSHGHHSTHSKEKAKKKMAKQSRKKNKQRK